MKLTVRATLVAAAILLGSVGTTVAGETISASGDSTAVFVVDVLQLEEGHQLILYRGKYVFIAQDTSTPNHLAVGDCYASVDAQGELESVQGYCAFTDRGGDRYFVRFERGTGEEDGRWSVIAGTGKWDGATGGGTYVSETISPPPNGRAVTHLTGEIVMP